MAGSKRYTTGRPMQDVRLRNWPAGKVAQLKRAVELLEGQLNETMASQVDQGTKRVFSARVPKVTGLSINAGFKNFQIFFNAAKGISDLLFYEIQKSATSSFATYTTYTIPQTTLTIPTTTEHELVFFRVRVMNSQFEVGPWSTIARAVGSSNFRITVTRQEEPSTVSLPWNITDPWVDVGGTTYLPSAASTCIHAHVGIYTHISKEVNGTVPATDIFNFDHIVFRFLRNGVVLSNVGTMVLEATATYDNRAGESDDAQEKTEMAEIGTIITPLETFVGNEEAVTYTLQAQRITGSSSRGSTLDDTTILLDAFDVVELVQSF